MSLDSASPDSVLNQNESIPLLCSHCEKNVLPIVLVECR